MMKRSTINTKLFLKFYLFERKYLNVRRKKLHQNLFKFKMSERQFPRMSTTISDSLEDDDEDDSKEIAPIDYYGILNISRNVTILG
jgi:hypothetical protein